MGGSKNFVFIGKRAMKYCIVLALLVGCTSKTHLLPQAKSINITNEKPKDCRLLGQEVGQKIDTWSSMSLLDLRESALNDLKNKSATLGGDTLYILNMEKGWNSFWDSQEYLIEGEIYKCK
ncbi:DUF4156 domain-containing protein [Helicobacter marmotae]|uniref:DUF4156 domain-containing protein n=2 Tax=Helicobacter marmotae TaxID=152490 RepID=A0A3D8I1I5_9HELI|nr:DUF4156 domain-containing protein [Helicobacter marmotae]